MMIITDDPSQLGMDKNVDPKLKEIINSRLVKDFYQRPTAEEILTNQYFENSSDVSYIQNYLLLNFPWLINRARLQDFQLFKQTKNFSRSLKNESYKFKQKRQHINMVLVSVLIFNIIRMTSGLDLEDIDSSESGRSLLNTIYLQLGSADGRVPETLAKIKADLRDQQIQDDTLRKRRIQECTFEIVFLDRPIEVMDSEIERSNAIVAEKEPLLNTTIALTAVLQTKLEFFSRHIMANEMIHISEVDQLRQTVQQLQEAQKAVKNGLEYLEMLQDPYVDSAIRPNNDHMEVIPVSSFLETQKDQISYTRLIDIITDIENYISGQIKDIENLITQKEDLYQEYRKYCEQIRADITLILESLKSQQMSLSEDIEEARRMIVESSEERGSMVRAKVDKETECGAWTSQYLSDKSRRQEEFQLIDEVLNSLSEDI